MTPFGVYVHVPFCAHRGDVVVTQVVAVVVGREGAVVAAVRAKGHVDVDAEGSHVADSVAAAGANARASA